MSENRKLLEMNVPMWFDGKSIDKMCRLRMVFSLWGKQAE